MGVVTLGACGSAAAPSAAPPPSTFSADSWVDALTDAGDVGADQLESRLVPTTRGGVPHAVLGVDDGGRLLTSRVTGRGTDRLGTPHVGWLDADGFTPLRYDASASKGHQVTAVDHDGDDVVWVETTSTDPGLFDWTVWASSGHGRREVDSSDRLGPADRQKRVFGMTEPVVAGGRTFWSASVSGSDTTVLGGSTTGAAARADDIAGAGLPALSGGNLYLVRSPSVATREGGQTRIVAHDIATGREKVVARAELGSSRVLTRLVASDHQLAWVVADAEAGRSQLFVKDLRSGTTRGVRMDHPGLQTMALGVSDRLAVWGNGSTDGDAGEYALDLADGTVWRLGDQPGYSVAFVDGSTVAWAELPDGDPTASADFRVGRWPTGA